MYFQKLLSRSVLIVALLSAGVLKADELSLNLKSLNDDQKKVLSKTFAEINELLPSSFIKGMPKNIEIKIERLSDHKEVPKDVCEVNLDQKKNKNKFVYGQYNNFTNVLKINVPVFEELKKGKDQSFKISCQHKSLYNQSIATIVHELSHGYDSNNKVSSRMSFVRRAGFQKGFFNDKNKNVEAMRSADQYELANVKEAFAVNFEYFILDEEFACRKPSMFDYYKDQFIFDPYPKRNCRLNTNVMVSTEQGFFPEEIDPRRVYRIDYLLASKGNEISSGFGHSMFRLVICAPERLDMYTNKKIPATPFGKKCLEDKFYHLVVSYRANIEDSKQDPLKGLTGGYPSMLFMFNLYSIFEEYNNEELRDLVAYPLKLSEKEKEDMVKKIIEDHWNYKGAYKFLTNNCAVESIDLLKASLFNFKLNNQKPFTPYGMLEDLNSLGLIDANDPDVETFKAKTEQLIESYKRAYGYKLKGEKKDKEAIVAFINHSDSSDRKKAFEEFSNGVHLDADSYAELVDLKNDLIKSSSFSIIEQQILRTSGLVFRKKVAEVLSQKSSDELNQKVDALSNKFKINFEDLSSNGYGVPLEEEMRSKDAVISEVKEKLKANEEVDKMLKSIMPEEYDKLNDLVESIKSINAFSIKLRKAYRENLDKYVLATLGRMILNSKDKQLLQEVKKGNKS
ncbi:MAG: DUF7844 domain-containing protein, partial [Bacteriovorax sp.]